MDETIPIACTLTAADLRDRQLAWLKVGHYARSSTDIRGGLTFLFHAAPGVDESLRELVRLEGECCAWMAFALETTPDSVTLWVTADGEDGERGVRLAFAPLVSALFSRDLE